MSSPPYPQYISDEDLGYQGNAGQRTSTAPNANSQYSYTALMRVNEVISSAIVMADANIAGTGDLESLRGVGNTGGSKEQQWSTAATIGSIASK
ncbi:MAG: 1-acylglycerol-3-phosphate O-acyltransferase [Chaenotheca gracillima]|nr:MAG: 1-acylglycerol-3-phosphate O-acyltransferase [Chaenotheca gracillima]